MDKVFARRPRAVENMIWFIFEACQEIDADKDICSRAGMSGCSRLEECVNADSRQFESLKDKGFLLHVMQHSFFV